MVLAMGIYESMDVPMVVDRPFKAPVNDHLVDKEVGGAVGHNAKAKSGQPTGSPLGANEYSEKTRYSEKKGEKIVFLPPTGGDRNMMILMEAPKKSMHHILVQRPGDPLHGDKDNDKYGNIKAH